MIMKGQKRKLPPEEMEVSDRSNPFWESQRQFVFSVSLNKYQRSQELPEPSLRRSVLIANTLRQVSLEACGAPSAEWEVSQPPCSSSNGLLTLDNTSHCAINRSTPSGALSAPNAPLPVRDEDEDWGSMSMDSDFSLSAAISSILTALDSTMDGSTQAAPRTPLRSLENLSGLPEGGVRLGGRDCGEQQRDCRAGSSYLSDLTVEDLFQDIDTSLLERDMCVLGLRGSGNVAGDELLRYLPPFSPVSPLSLNQNLKCLPSFSSFSPLSSSSSSSSSSSPSLSLPHFSAANHVELEHLMEILVES
ncbi:SERTA domain-containing protein 3 [Halichoeres trimaculatus]|uniref:SERTA domain-containing protein 3 n=1 Tax=Halichoeres trimaculatus TaxID=147232 RepID=UPI003D9F1F97